MVNYPAFVWASWGLVSGPSPYPEDQMVRRPVFRPSLQVNPRRRSLSNSSVGPAFGSQARQKREERRGQGSPLGQSFPGLARGGGTLRLPSPLLGTKLLSAPLSVPAGFRDRSQFEFKSVTRPGRCRNGANLGAGKGSPDPVCAHGDGGLCGARSLPGPTESAGRGREGRESPL